MEEDGGRGEFMLERNKRAWEKGLAGSRTFTGRLTKTEVIDEHRGRRGWQGSSEVNVWVLCAHALRSIVQRQQQQSGKRGRMATWAAKSSISTGGM
jgi:hypothetical protein